MSASVLDLDLDLLIELSVTQADLEENRGFARTKLHANVPLLKANSKKPTAKRKSPRWTAAEDDFLRRSLGWLTDDEIGAALGRSQVAVHLRWSRDLHLPAPSRHPDFLTGHQASRLVGLDEHKITHWCDMGLIPHRLMAGDRKVRLIYRTTFYRWVVSPSNWIYFDWTRIPDPHLRRLCEIRSQRWGDEWWTTRQVADYHGVTTGDVKRLLKRGELPATQVAVSRGGRNHNPAWLNWYVKKSDALQARFFKGYSGIVPWQPSPAAAAWIRKARFELGLSYPAIARSMGNIVSKQTIWNFLNSR